MHGGTTESIKKLVKLSFDFSEMRSYVSPSTMEKKMNKANSLAPLINLIPLSGFMTVAELREARAPPRSSDGM